MSSPAVGVGGASPTVLERFPVPGIRSLAEVLDRWSADLPGPDLRFGDERVLVFLEALSRAFLRPAVTRAHPELAALGTFLRPRRLRRLVEAKAPSADLLRFPVGRVLHVPPTNVATVFVYSWALSALAGNRNVVRLSPNAPEVTRTLLEVVLGAQAEADPVVAATQLMVTYDRDEQTTAALSAVCDLRVLWGGDASVQALRRHDLSPAARDLCFPDRSSLAVLSARGWADAAEGERRRVVQAFHNDVFWFDQAACSSPRTVVWLGEEDLVGTCAAELTRLLAAQARERGVVLDASMSLHKRVSTYGLALTGAGRALTYDGSTVAHVLLDPGSQINRTWLGAGTLAGLAVRRITDLRGLVGPKEQTVTHAFLSRVQVQELSEVAGALGVDRVVPVGHALDFGPVWDGHDLLEEFSRRTVVQFD